MNEILAKRYYKKLQNIISNLFDSPACGGNISVKFQDKIMIKTSGTDLKRDKDYVIVDEHSIKIQNKKPSMEYSFHKIIPYRFVLHYHPIYLLPWLCDKNSDKILNHTFEGISSYFRIIDYYMPGTELSKQIEIDPQANVYFLKNHGVIIASDDFSSIEKFYWIIRNKSMPNLSFDSFTTPDDFILSDNPELILFHWTIKALTTNLKCLNDDSINLLKNSLDEQYRRKASLK